MLHILKLDNLREQSASLEGDYDILYTNLLRSGGYNGPITHYETRGQSEYPSKVLRGDTVFLSGSRLDAFENDEFTLKLLDFIKKNIDEPDVRFIGVCYGHQIIARALGAEVYRASMFELGVLPLHLTVEGSKYFREFTTGDNLIQVHKDQVRSLPERAIHLAQTADCFVQSYLVPGKALCIQGHPEFTKLTLEIIMREIQDKEAVSRSLSTINLPYASTKLGHGFARFANREDR